MSKRLSTFNILQSNGPLSSSVVKKTMMDGGISEVAARQRISRSGEFVQRYSSLPLLKREAFLFLEDQYGSIDFWNELIKSHTATLYRSTA